MGFELIFSEEPIVKLGPGEAKVYPLVISVQFVTYPIEKEY